MTRLMRAQVFEMRPSRDQARVCRNTMLWIVTYAFIQGIWMVSAPFVAYPKDGRMSRIYTFSQQYIDISHC